MLNAGFYKTLPEGNIFVTKNIRKFQGRLLKEVFCWFYAILAKEHKNYFNTILPTIEFQNQNIYFLSGILYREGKKA